MKDLLAKLEAAECGLRELLQMYDDLREAAQSVVDTTLYRGEGYELVRSMDRVLDKIAALRARSLPGGEK